VSGQVGGGLGPPGYLQLAQDARDVVLDRLLGHDLAVLGLEDVRALKNSRTARVELDRLYGAAAPRVGAKMKLGKVSKAGDRPPGKGDDNDLPRLGRDTAHPETEPPRD